MTNTLCTFKNKNLFKNLSSLIFQLVPFLYKPLVLSLAWKILGSYTRIFAVLSSTIKSNDLLKKEQRAKDSDSFSLEIRDEDLKRTNLFALGHQRCWWESLFCRGGGTFWNVMGKGGGSSLHSHAHTPTQIFQNAGFALFLGTRKTLCNVHSVFCVRNPFQTMHP